MERVDITIGSVAGGIGRVLIEGDASKAEIRVEADDLVHCRRVGQRPTMALIVENGGASARRILKSAMSDGAPVYLDGKPILPVVLEAVLIHRARREPARPTLLN
jgi:hypothetical protein